MMLSTPTTMVTPDSRMLSEITPAPCSRSLIVGWTGSGKSTLLEVLLESYHRLHRYHWLYVFDPKQRYFPVEPDPSDHTLFPAGFEAIEQGPRRGVPIVGQRITKPRAPDMEGKVIDGALIVTEPEDMLRLCDWLHANSDVRTPSLLCLDESIELMKGVQAHKNFRRITQQGRELGIGCIILNQRPTYIDGTWITESSSIYCGSLIKSDDRRRIADNVAVPDAFRYLREPLHDYEWLLFDQRSHTVTGPFDLIL